MWLSLLLGAFAVFYLLLPTLFRQILSRYNIKIKSFGFRGITGISWDPQVADLGLFGIDSIQIYLLNGIIQVDIGSIRTTVHILTSPKPSNNLIEQALLKKLKTIKGLLNGYLGRVVLQYVNLHLQEIIVNVDYVFQLHLNHLRISKHMDIVKPEILESLYGKEYTSAHELSLHLGGLSLYIRDVHTNDDVSESTDLKKIIFSNGPASISMSFANVKNHQGVLGIFCSLDGYTLISDKAVRIKNHPEIARFLDGLRAAPPSPPMPPLIIQDMLDLFRPRFSIQLSQLSIFQTFNSFEQFSDCNANTSAFLSFRIIKALILTPFDAETLTLATLSFEDGNLDILNLPKSKKKFSHVASIKEIHCNAKFQTDGINPKAMDLSVSFHTPTIIIDDTVVSFVNDNSTKTHLFRKGTLDESEAENCSVAHVVAQSNLILERLKLICTKVSSVISIELISSTIGLMLHDLEELNFDDGVVYLHIPTCKINVSAPLYFPLPLGSLESNEIILYGSLKLEHLRVGHLFIQSEQRELLIDDILKSSTDDSQKLLILHDILVSLRVSTISDLSVAVSLLDLNLSPISYRNGQGSLWMALKLASLSQIMSQPPTSQAMAPAHYFPMSISLDIQSLAVALVSEIQPCHSVMITFKKVSITKKLDRSHSGADLILMETISDCRTEHAKKEELFKLTGARLDSHNLHPLKLNIKKILIHISITQLYLCLVSITFPRKLAKIFSNEKHYSEKSHLHIEVFVPHLRIQVLLPENVVFVSDFQHITLVGSSSQLLNGKINSIVAEVLVPDQNETENERKSQQFCRILTMEDIKLRLNDRHPVDISCNSRKFQVIIPAAFAFYHLIENAITFNKASKVLMTKYLGTGSLSGFELGETHIKAEDVPNIILSFDLCEIIFGDSSFDASLSRNYRLGFIENAERLLVEKAFIKACIARGVNFNDMEQHMIGMGYKRSDDAMDTVLAAWGLSLKHSSDTYIKRHQEISKIPYPDLMVTRFTQLSIQISGPVLEGISVEKTLHIIDCTTPKDILYDDLIPRNVKMSLSSWEIRLKDYEFPLLLVPLETKWETNGLIILADPTPLPESLKVIELPLEIKNTTISLSRNVNPIKIYTRTVTSISTKTSIRACAGVCFEPTLADIIQVVDSFTKPSADISPPIGWWDKLRHVFHGNNQLKFLNPGSLVLRIFGSNSPYFDPRRHFGSAGVEVCLRGGVDLQLGGLAEKSEIIINCGELKIAIPDSRTNISKTKEDADILNDASKFSNSPLSELCVGKSSGGVSIKMSMDFLTKNEKELDLLEVKPWKRHHEIVLRTPRSCPNLISVFHYITKGWDSYVGFRTSSMHFRLDVTAPKTNVVSADSPMNTIFLNSTILSNIQMIEGIYQSVLTSMPIKRGKVFNADYKSVDKPKIGNTVRRIHFTSNFSPIVVSSMSELEDLTGGVGVRARAELMIVNVIYVQKNSVATKNALNEPKSLEQKRKPVTKWSAESSQITLSIIEARIITYKSEIAYASVNVDNAASEWVFEEDLKFVGKYSDLEMFPFLWSPKVCFYYVNDAKGVVDTAERQRETTTDIQISLYDERLQELEKEISQTIEIQGSLASRAAVWFDAQCSTQLDELCKTLEALYEKKIALEKHISSCKYKSDHNGAKLDSKKKEIFEQNYTIHNVNILWNVPVRNAVFKIIELQTKDFQVKYCLSNTAARVVSDLVKKSMRSRTRSITQPKNLMSMNVLSIQKQTDTMLKALLEDLEMGINLMISDETSDSNNSTRLGTHAETNSDGFQRSSDPSSPDFVRSDHIVEFDTLCKFINPQICFEMITKSKKQCLIIAAPKTEVTSVTILDSAAADRVAYLDSDRADMIFKTRTILNISQAQFLVGKDLGDAERNYKWPYWVPIESLIDFRISIAHLHRTIDQTNMTYYRDKLNTLFVSSQPDFEDNGHNTFTITCPNLTGNATQQQYAIWVECFNKLLIYRDPDSGQRADRLRKMLLVFEQASNMVQIRDRFMSLQERCRKLDSALNTSSTPDDPAKMMEFRKTWASSRDELYVYMEALKHLREFSEKRKSIRPAWQLSITIDHFDWFMLQDNDEPFCRWTLDSTNFNWVNNEDQSSYNTLEVDAIKLEDLMVTAIYREVLSALGNERRDLEYTKHKLVRIIWRENAPVGGIPVVEHFELNIQPLLIQITNEFSKTMMKYFFAEIVTTGEWSEEDGGSDTSSNLSKKADKKNQDSIKRNGSLRRSQIKKPQNDIFALALSHDIKKQTEMIEMQTRALESRSFIYIKVPGIDICLSFRGSKEKSLIDLTGVIFHLPTLEYRNKTWMWYDVVQAVRKDIMRAALANTGTLVKEKLFIKKHSDGGVISISEDVTDSKKKGFINAIRKKTASLRSSKIPEVPPQISPRQLADISTGSVPLQNASFSNSMDSLDLDEESYKGRTFEDGSEMSSFYRNSENLVPEGLAAKGKLLFGRFYIPPTDV